MVLALVAFTASFATVLFHAQLDERRPADAIVVLGAAQYNGRPSPVTVVDIGRFAHHLHVCHDRGIG